MRRILLLLGFVFILKTSLFAQVAKTQVIQINAKAQADGITLNWPLRTFTGSYTIYRRTSLSILGWGTPIATLNNDATSYKDISAVPGNAYDYWIIAAQGTSAIAYGYIYAGNELKEVPYKGGIVLLIDSNYMLPLASEIARLNNDLSAEGWEVSTMYAGRNSSPASVKARLVPFVKSRRRTVTTLLILGHIPVPYSGGFTGDGSNYPPPDGHVEGSGNHTGAWPADVYYGDLDGLWEDVNISLTTGNQTRHHNIPGDGKFDPTKIPGSIELEVGRIDLFNMPLFGKSDTVLTRNYLNRNHLWRTGRLSATERGLIDDNFTSFNLASTGWQNFSAFFPIDSVVNTKDYVTELKSNSYLWSYGCGAGSYTTCNGIGSSSNFANDSLQHIFTILAGSFFGDWDNSNAFLKAPLGRSALASFWGGIPKWYIHTMALGKHLGYGTRITQNNNGFYFTGGFNYSDSSVHIALMGDPTLCNRHLPPVKGLIASSSNKRVNLIWNKSYGTFDSYVVYRHDTAKNIFIRVSKYPVNDTTYTDSFNYFSGTYRYIVRTIKKETTSSGTYFNLGGGSYADLLHLNSISGINKNELSFYPNPAQNYIRYNDEGLSNFEIYDMAGRKYDIVHDASNKQIQTDALPAGNYILKCTDINGFEISTFIIKY